MSSFIFEFTLFNNYRKYNKMDKKRGCKDLHNMLKKKNFYSEGMNELQIQDIVLYIKAHHMLPQFVEVVISTQLNHYTLTKTILIIFSLLQAD